MDNRPKLLVEMAEDERPVRVQWPHCDPRILHLPEECEYCADATTLQEERVVLEVSNSGYANRKYPCPADQARSKSQYSNWYGNRPKVTK